MTEGVQVGLVCGEFRGNRTHERIGPEQLDKRHPSTETGTVSAFGRWLDAIGDRLFCFGKPKAYDVQAIRGMGSDLLGSWAL